MEVGGWVNLWAGRDMTNLYFPGNLWKYLPWVTRTEQVTWQFLKFEL